MSQKITGIKGMEDLYQAEDVRLWQKVEEKARKTFEPAGFQEIRTPIVEDAALFERSVGEATDIVEKEMYILYDRNEKRLALRPEGTASIVRSFIEHFTSHNISEGRFYYLGPMYRYERPQKGRLRQFYQIGAEVFGTDHPLADAEMIALVVQLFKELGLKKYELQLNSLGSRECRIKYREALKKFLTKVCGAWDKEVQERVQRNPLRVLDSKDEAVQKALEQAPNILDFLSSESKSHFEEVQRALQQIGISFTVNPRTVRGLDYYEKTVFEFISEELGAQNTVAAGGRYNDLVKDLGGPPVPGVGFALGMERLTSLLPRESITGSALPRVYLIGLDEQADQDLFTQLEGIREAGAQVQMDFGGSSLKSKMRRASKWDAQWVVLAGHEERSRGVIVVRNMEAGNQEEIPPDELISHLLSKFPTQTFLG